MKTFKITSRHASETNPDLHTCLLEGATAEAATARHIVLASFFADGTGQGAVVSCVEVDPAAERAAEKAARRAKDARVARAMRESGER